MMVGKIPDRFQMGAQRHENDRKIENQETNGDARLPTCSMSVDITLPSSEVEAQRCLQNSDEEMVCVGP